MLPTIKTSLIVSCLTAVGGATTAFACDLCSVYNAPLAHGVIEQGIHVSLAEQFTHFGTLQLESHEVRNEANQRLDSSVSQVALGYHFTDRLGLQFSLPVIHRSFRRAEGGEIESGTESGIGDVALSGSYVLVRRDKEKWSLAWNAFGGVKFPTGDTGRLREELAEEAPVPGEVESAVHGHDLTLGSGSYDGFVGTQFYSRYRRGFFTAETQYAIRSRGDFDYRFANDLTWSGGPGFYLIFAEELTLALQANISGETKGRDEFRGEKAEDTAITAVYAGPRLSLSWRDRLSVELGAGLPVDIQNSALQAVPDYRVQGSVVWRF
jgi:hypothetical protein